MEMFNFNNQEGQGKKLDLIGDNNLNFMSTRMKMGNIIL